MLRSKMGYPPPRTRALCVLREVHRDFKGNFSVYSVRSVVDYLLEQVGIISTVTVSVNWPVLIGTAPQVH